MDQLNKLLGTLSVKQRWTILAAVLLVAAAIFGFSRWQQESSFRPLYNSLSPEDASAVIQKLKESATPYRLTNNGATILVPEDKVAELRLEMAGAGVPKNGRIGFEIFDRTNFGVTDFAEHVNYRRALEGELERSIVSVAEIEQARVHISLPQDSVFAENRQPAKASVLVKIRPGMSLPETAMPAITNLVASAVEGLSPDNVSVLDMRGNLLNRPKRIGARDDDTSDAALEYRHKVEQDLAAKLDSTLEPLVGAGRFRTAVSAECDMSNGEQSEESFDPTKSVMVSSSKTEDISTNPHPAGGIPGTASNLPDANQKAIAGTSTTSRKTENINYETAHTVKRVVLPQGAIKRLSISVLLDQDVRFDGTGEHAKRILEAPSTERMKVIHDLAAAAVGFDAARGDQLIVESLPFESTLNLEPPDSTPVKNDLKKKTPLDQIKSDPKMIIEIGAAFVVLLGGGFFVAYQKLKSKGTRVEITQQAALPRPIEEEAQSRTAQDSYTPSLGAGSPVPALAPGRIETLTNQIRATAHKDAEVCAGVLRGWLRDGA